MYIINHHFSNSPEIEFIFFEYKDGSIIQYTCTRSTSRILSPPLSPTSSVTSQLMTQTKIISENDFYLFHLTHHLYTYIHSFIPPGAQCRYCFCGSGDMNGVVQRLQLPELPLIINHDEAKSLYCQSLLPNNHQHKHVYFLQLHILSDRCKLLMNHIYATHTVNEGMYKHIDTKDIHISIMDKISDRLWTFIQNHPTTVTKCTHHHRLFTSANKSIAVSKIKTYLIKVTYTWLVVFVLTFLCIVIFRYTKH